MVVNIYDQAFQSGGLSQNDFHRAHGLFAGLYILCGCAILRTFLIVGFYLLDLFLIQQHFCNTRMVLNGYRQPIRHGLVHGVAVNFFTECLVGFRNGRTGKAYKGCLGECLPQNFCIRLGDHSPHILVRILAELNLFGVFQLCTVGLIRETDDIGPIVDQADFIIFPVAKLLNRADVEATACPCAQLLPQSPSAFHNADLTKIQKFLTLGKQICALFLQLLPVNNHDNRR